MLSREQKLGIETLGFVNYYLEEIIWSEKEKELNSSKRRKAGRGRREREKIKEKIILSSPLSVVLGI